MIPLLASGGKSFREKIPKTDAMTDILWYPYECEIICRTQTAAGRRFEKEGIFMLETGIRGRQSVAVTPENTAKTMGSGTLNVFATPALVALAEKTCWMSVADALDEGCGSVGTKLELEHTAPTPVGMTVTCERAKTLFGLRARQARWAAGRQPKAAARPGPVLPAGAGLPARWRGTVPDTSLYSPAQPTPPSVPVLGDSLPGRPQKNQVRSLS